jgi:hypothetical protein
MAASDTVLANMAFGYLGLGTVADLSSTTDEKVVAANLYLENVRGRLLRAHPWGFARVEFQLTGEADDTSYEWSKSYTAPNTTTMAKALYLIDGVRIGSHTVPSPPIPFEVRSIDGNTQKIYTDEDDAYLAYTKYVTDTTKYTQEFDKLFALELALEIMPKLGKGDPYNMGPKLAQMRDDAFAKAVAADFSTRVQDDPPDPEMIAIR